VIKRNSIIGSIVGTTAIAIGAFVASAAACNADPLLVPKGIDVPLVFDQSISSKHAKAGDTVQLHVAHDIMVNGQTVIRHGAHVTALVTSVQHRNVFGINGHLRLAFEPVKSISGKMIDIEPERAGKGSGSRPDHAAEISGGAAILLGPVGLIGGVFIKGKNVDIKPGDKIMSDVSHDTHIRS
jgi:hypothetical protein